MNNGKPCLLSADNTFAVPKSVIWMCISSFNKMFSGLRSLEKTDFYIQTAHKLKLQNCLVT